MKVMLITLQINSHVINQCNKMLIYNTNNFAILVPYTVEGIHSICRNKSCYVVLPYDVQFMSQFHRCYHCYALLGPTGEGN
jgi:hypothetical protein